MDSIDVIRKELREGVSFELVSVKYVMHELDGELTELICLKEQSLTHGMATDNKIL